MDSNDLNRLKNMPEDQRRFFIERYDFIYTELNRLQMSMQTIETETQRLLDELQKLRTKEEQTYNNG